MVPESTQMAGQEARETASLASEPSEARSARPGPANGPQSAPYRPASLRQRVEAELDRIDAEGARGAYRYMNGTIAVRSVLRAIRAALEPPTQRAANNRYRRAALAAAGFCSQGCRDESGHHRRARKGKRTCGLCAGSNRSARPRAAKDG